MDATNDNHGMNFAEHHFGGCQFGDERLTRRAVATAAMVLRHPGGTLPQKLPGNDLLGFYRLANNPKVTHAKMIRAHCEQTLRAMDATDGVVLLVSDTTEVDFSGHSADDLGPIGNGHCRGLLCHNVLGVDFDSRQVLGLVNQITHKRRKVNKKEKANQKREHPERESRLWKRALENLPPVPDGRMWVHVCDRGADTFENIAFWENRGDKYVIRSKTSRKLAAGDDASDRLHERVRQMDRVPGRRTVRVSENRGQPAREAKVEMGFGGVTLAAPTHRRGEHSDAAVSAWAVHVREVDAPAGVRPLEWILLTNVAVNNQADAWLRVDWYRCRPIIEEYHKAQKTGCGIEQVQFTTRGALEVTLALLSVVATQLIRMRDMGRDERLKDRPASAVIAPIYVEVLSLMTFRQIRPLTAGEFYRSLAKLGGHLGRKSDKPPGWLVLWRGWMQLQPMVQAIEADRRNRCA